MTTAWEPVARVPQNRPARNRAYGRRARSEGASSASGDGGAGIEFILGAGPVGSGVRCRPREPASVRTLERHSSISPDRANGDKGGGRGWSREPIRLPTP